MQRGTTDRGSAQLKPASWMMSVQLGCREIGRLQSFDDFGLKRFGESARRTPAAWGTMRGAAEVSHARFGAYEAGVPAKALYSICILFDDLHVFHHMPIVFDWVCSLSFQKVGSWNLFNNTNAQPGHSRVAICRAAAQIATWNST